MTEIVASTHIAGVRIVHLSAFGDERGRFLETFRKEWFPERSWDVVQTNRSDSKAGVLRGLHYHRRQVDYWCVMHGAMRVGLADLRRSSSTFRASEAIEIDAENRIGLYIPVGVAHGFFAVADVTLSYIVDNYFDGSDELGVAWNDPDLAVPWGVTNPQLSRRDQQNPRLADIPAHLLPE